MLYFSLFLKLSQQPVLVVGGGDVASRKVEALLRAGAVVTLVAPRLDATLQRWVEEEQCTWIEDYYAPHYLDRRYVQVWATTDNPDLNHQVYADAKRLGILVNVVDDPAHCDFITPAMIERGRIQLAISSGGASPVLIRNLRARIEAILPQQLELQAEFAASKRQSIQTELPSVAERRQFWERFFAHPQLEHAADQAQLERLYQAELHASATPTDERTWIEYGQDIELLPLKALRIMQQAEWVIHPADCPMALLDLCRRDAERAKFHDEAELTQQLSQIQAKRTVILVNQTTEYAQIGAGERRITSGSLTF